MNTPSCRECAGTSFPAFWCRTCGAVKFGAESPAEQGEPCACLTLAEEEQPCLACTGMDIVRARHPELEILGSGDPDFPEECLPGKLVQVGETIERRVITPWLTRAMLDAATDPEDIGPGGGDPARLASYLLMTDPAHRGQVNWELIAKDLRDELLRVRDWALAHRRECPLTKEASG